LIKEENFANIFTEKTLQSFKVGLVGTPDMICIKEDGQIIPVDIKLGRLSRLGVKDEHLLQNVGEAILTENFFRKKVLMSYLIYFGSNSLVKIDIDEKMKKKFLNYKKQIEKICRIGNIPEMSTLPNFKRRVCPGCHVKPACDNIETLRRIS
jgi:CRISPR/Cas system-associated exonuclease Cas4 (RecB family)